MAVKREGGREGMGVEAGEVKVWRDSGARTGVSFGDTLIGTIKTKQQHKKLATQPRRESVSTLGLVFAFPLISPTAFPGAPKVCTNILTKQIFINFCALLAFGSSASESKVIRPDGRGYPT